jgi:hypothetical protein
MTDHTTYMLWVFYMAPISVVALLYLTFSACSSLCCVEFQYIPLLFWTAGEMRDDWSRVTNVPCFHLFVWQIGGFCFPRSWLEHRYGTHFVLRVSRYLYASFFLEVHNVILWNVIGLRISAVCLDAYPTNHITTTNSKRYKFQGIYH